MAAATVFHLLRRTLLGAVGTEHAAITGLGAQQLMAVRALMEESAGVRGHLFERGVIAMRTCQQRMKNDGVGCQGCGAPCRVDGNPALVVALVSCEGFVRSASYLTVAVLWS